MRWEEYSMQIWGLSHTRTRGELYLFIYPQIQSTDNLLPHPLSLFLRILRNRGNLQFLSKTTYVNVAQEQYSVASAKCIAADHFSI